MPKNVIETELTAKTGKFTQGLKDAESAVKKTQKSLKDLKTSGGSVVEQMNVAGVSLKGVKEAFTGGAAAGQVLAEGIKAIGTICRETMRIMHETAEAEAEMLKRNADNAREAAEANQRQREKTKELAEELRNLIATESKSAEQKVRQSQLISQLSGKFGALGIDIRTAAQSVQSFDAAMAKMLGNQHKRKLQEVESELAQLGADAEKQRQTIEDAGMHFGGWQFGGKADVEKATARLEQISKRRMELQKEKRNLEKSDPEKEYKETSRAKRSDAKKAKDEAWEKTIEGAKSAMDKWADELDRLTAQTGDEAIDIALKQKLKEIDQRFSAIENTGGIIGMGDEGERAGKELKQRAIAAAYAEAEKKREALRQKEASEQQAAADKYAEAQQKLQDAVAKRAQTETEIAEQNRKDKAQRAIDARKGQLERKKATFGFTLPDNFRLHQSASWRGRTRRNIETDASIAEKIGRAQSGEHVTWNKAEKERIRQLQRIEKQEQKLEERRARLVDKQESAADKLAEAGEAIKQAAKEVSALAPQKPQQAAKREPMLTQRKGKQPPQTQKPQQTQRKEQTQMQRQKPTLQQTLTQRRPPSPNDAAFAQRKQIISILAQMQNKFYTVR